jgi:hypothetical protein
MKKRHPEERAKLEQIFNAYCEEAMSAASEIHQERGKGYNSNVSVVDYFPHGEQDIIYELYKKLVRTENSMQAEESGNEVDGRVEDSIIDGINYFKFLYAYHKMRKEGTI